MSEGNSHQPDRLAEGFDSRAETQATAYRSALKKYTNKSRVSEIYSTTKKSLSGKKKKIHKDWTIGYVQLHPSKPQD